MTPPCSASLLLKALLVVTKLMRKQMYTCGAVVMGLMLDLWIFFLPLSKKFLSFLAGLFAGTRSAKFSVLVPVR